MKERSFITLTALRLDGWRPSQYASPMSRFLKSLILLSLVAPLTGCGIKGGLKTPPPLWGADDTSGEDMADEQTEAPEAETEASSDDADFGYGVDVTRKP